MIGIHARRLLEAVGGEPHRDGLQAPLLAGVDWRSLGVSRPYAIFMTGRCGSTWLTSVLQKTGLVGNPGEFFNSDVAKRERRAATGLQAYFESVVLRESSNARFGLEIDSIRLRQIEPLIDWNSVLPPGSASTFFLYRSNLLAQAWSWVSARKSGLWHQRVGAAHNEQRRESLPPSEKELIREMARIRACEEYLESFFDARGYAPYYVDYETLMTDLASEIRSMLRMLGVSVDLVDAVRIADETAVERIKYDLKSRVLAEFTDRYAAAISRLRRDRFQVAATEILSLFSATG